MTELLVGWKDGNKEDFAELFQRCEEDLTILAKSLLKRNGRNALVETKLLVNDLYIKWFSKEKVNADTVTEFIRFSSNAMRGILIDYLRKENKIHMPLRESDRKGFMGSQLELEQAMDKLGQLDVLAAVITELYLVYGMKQKDIAIVLEKDINTIQRGWAFAKNYLYDHLK